MAVCPLHVWGCHFITWIRVVSLYSVEMHQLIVSSMCYNNSDLQGVFRIAAYAVFIFTFDDPTKLRTQAEDNCTAKHSFCFFYLIGAPLRGSTQVFVKLRERMWSQMANIAKSFPRLTPTPRPHPSPPQRAHTVRKSAFHYWVVFPLRLRKK